MGEFNYSLIRDKKWDSDLLGLVAAIYKEAGKQEMYLKQRPEELEKLVEIAKIQSTEASNAIEGIVTTDTRIRQLALKKQRQKTGMSRKSRVTGMCWESYMRVLTQFRSHRTISFSCTKSSTAI